MFGDAVGAFIGLVLFGGTLVFLTRQDSLRTSTIYLAALLGGIYATLPKIFYWSDTYFWIWMLLMPVAAAWLVSQRTGQLVATRAGMN